MPMETLQNSIAMIANIKIKGVSPMAQRYHYRVDHYNVLQVVLIQKMDVF